MTIFNPSRRRLAALPAGLGSLGLADAAGSPDAARRGNMARAPSSLYDALASMPGASSPSGGRPDTAVDWIWQPISEVEAGVLSADPQGGCSL